MQEPEELQHSAPACQSLPALSRPPEMMDTVDMFVTISTGGHGHGTSGQYWAFSVYMWEAKETPFSDTSGYLA